MELQSLSLELSAPVLEELPRPGLLLVVPTLAEDLLEHVSGVDPLVVGEQS